MAAPTEQMSAISLNKPKGSGKLDIYYESFIIVLGVSGCIMLAISMVYKWGIESAYGIICNLAGK